MKDKIFTPVNLALIALAISAFGIGTTEFVIMGLLPDVARDLNVSIPSAGLLITGYALGVAIGAPIMALVTSKFPRKRTLVMLMGIFIAGNALCALSTDYTVLMLARVLTSLCHGAFFGIGSVTAASLVAPNRRASAVAMMFTGLTLANVLGVPMGTALGQDMGWRTTFWAVTAIGVIAFGALLRLLPADKGETGTNILQEIGALKNAGVWVALSLTVLFSASMFTLFTYIAPMLTDLTHLSPSGISYTLLLIGLGLTIGNVVGGKLADWNLTRTLLGTAAVIAAVQALFYWTSGSVIPAEATLFFWAATAFAAVSALQMNAMLFGKDAPSLIATLNIGAFNAGNALGAWAGARVIDAGFGLRVVPLYAGGFALLGLVVALVLIQLGRQEKAKLQVS